VNDQAVDVESDALVEPITQESGMVAYVVSLVGFLGEGPEGHCRLYADPELRAGWDIRSEDIVHRDIIPAEHDEIGGRSVIWVEREAMRARTVEEEPAQRLEAAFLTGPLASGIQLPERRPGFAEPLAATKGSMCKISRRVRFCPR
jgi:hypothetical protein